MIFFQRLFESCGGIVRDQWHVKCIIPTAGGGVEVQGNTSDTACAARAVICAGPWTEPLLSALGIKLPLT